MVTLGEWGVLMSEVPLLAAGGIKRKGSIAGERSEREFFIDNLLIRIHLIIGMILADWPCAMGGERSPEGRRS